MAKFDENKAQEVFAPHLNPGEELKYFAYGVKQPNIMIIILLTALAILPGIIATFMLTKNYLIGLTGSRLLILEIKSIANPEVQSIAEFSLSELQSLPIKTSTGPIFTHIEIEHPDKPFKAKCHRAFSEWNRPNAVAITEVINPSA